MPTCIYRLAHLDFLNQLRCVKRMRFFPSFGILFLALVCRQSLQAGSATDISGLYYPGLTSTGGLQPGGGRDSNWDVTYAYVNGSRFRNESTYTSASGAYVLSSAYIDSAYVSNTSSAQWITAPGAMTASVGGSANIGGVYLPGNGTTGTNAAFYVYQLAFSIIGTGSGVATNQIAISLTIAADDAYSIYVSQNPVTVTGGGAINADYAVSASGTNAWNNTTAVNLQNYGSGGANNTTFNIGTNYLTIVVSNTNSIVGSSANSDFNPSGLLVYQVGSLATIDGRPIPEVGSSLPLLGAMALYGVSIWRRRRPASQAGVAGNKPT